MASSCWRRRIQTNGELAFVVVSFGIAMGCSSHNVHSTSRRRHRSSARHRGRIIRLFACDAFAHCRWSRRGVRAALGRDANLRACTARISVMLGLSLVMVIGAAPCARRIARRLGTGKGTLVGGGLNQTGTIAAM